jgi:chemotaxis response regulator CheB
MTPKPIRVLVIDDSAYNRQTITSMLETSPDIQVVGRAVDGEEGLRLAFQLIPDVITLDLEMPKMDGFSFLRILMSRRATPVIVISGYATKDNVFKALELGALDFVAKPSRTITPELKGIKDELIAKVRLVTQLRMVTLSDRAWRVVEAESGDAVTVGSVLIAPGAGSLVVRRDGLQLKAEIAPALPEDRFVPSVDKMLDSVARHVGADALGIILTGMAGDGGRGVKALRSSGARVVVESPETAIIAGMPQEAISTGAVDEVLPLGDIVEAIARFARR